MKKYYIITPESKLYEEYWQYRQNRVATCEIYKDFKEKQGIESHGYCVYNDSIYIVPTPADLINFQSQLCKETINDDLRRFKANSKVNKAWVKTLSELKHKVIHKPVVPFFFNGAGHSFSSLFDIDGVIYCSYELNCDFENPEGFQEIKASVFHKIVEDEMEKRDGQA